MHSFLLNSTAWLFLGILLWCILFSFANKVDEEESCRVYAGGQVYPQERRTSEHALHWSKAQIAKPAPYWEGTAVVNGEFKSLNITDFRVCKFKTILIGGEVCNGVQNLATNFEKVCEKCCEIDSKYLVFFFYPLDFTFVCPTEIIAFSNRIEEFRKINTEVVACSVDSVFTHLAWINTPRKDGGLGKLSYPLLSDLNHQIAKDYGVLLENEGHTLRGLFIIDDKGVLRQITMNDLPVGRSVDETLRLVQAFQYTDKHGEVCPAGWKPGSDTIVPDPKEKLDYFTKHDEDGPDSPKDEM